MAWRGGSVPRPQLDVLVRSAFTPRCSTGGSLARLPAQPGSSCLGPDCLMHPWPRPTLPASGLSPGPRRWLWPAQSLSLLASVSVALLCPDSVSVISASFSPTHLYPESASPTFLLFFGLLDDRTSLSPSLFGSKIRYPLVCSRGCWKRALLQPEVGEIPQRLRAFDGLPDLAWGLAVAILSPGRKRPHIRAWLHSGLCGSRGRGGSLSRSLGILPPGKP